MADFFPVLPPSAFPAGVTNAFAEFERKVHRRVNLHEATLTITVNRAGHKLELCLPLGFRSFLFLYVCRETLINTIIGATLLAFLIITETS